jgi:hypothetical protein
MMKSKLSESGTRFPPSPRSETASWCAAIGTRSLQDGNDITDAYDLHQMRRAPDQVRGSRGIRLAVRDGLFAVPKDPLAAQLGPNLRVGIGAYDVAANDHIVLIDRVLIGRLLRRAPQAAQSPGQTRRASY